MFYQQYMLLLSRINFLLYMNSMMFILDFLFENVSFNRPIILEHIMFSFIMSPSKKVNIDFSFHFNFN